MRHHIDTEIKVTRAELAIDAGRVVDLAHMPIRYLPLMQVPDGADMAALELVVSVKGWATRGNVWRNTPPEEAIDVVLTRATLCFYDADGTVVGNVNLKGLDDLAGIYADEIDVAADVALCAV